MAPYAEGAAVARNGGSFARHRRCVTFREGNPTNSAPPVRCELSTAHRGAWRTIVSAAGVNQGSEADDGIAAGAHGGTGKIAAKAGFSTPIGEARSM
jgi:hypothetical protein